MILHMHFLTNKSKELLAGLVGDFAKILLAGYFASEFFLNLPTIHKIVFWAIFTFLVIVFLILTVEKKKGTKK